MADVATVLAAADAEYAPVRAGLATLQQQQAPILGRFWQGSCTHSIIPADGVKRPVDVALKTPTDETVPWPANLRSLSTLAAYTCHKYQAPPANHGFLVLRQVVINGDLYMATEDVGGYVGSRPWAKVTPPEV